jgi:hypothetical protein
MSYPEGLNHNDPQRIIDMYADDVQFRVLPSSLGGAPPMKGKEMGASMLKMLLSVMPKGKVIAPSITWHAQPAKRRFVLGCGQRYL